ncbi:unnamed protein product, partial [Heterotrigona itama]
AYGLVIYLISSQNDGHSTPKLLCAKSCVALKSINLLHLELCVALLLPPRLLYCADFTIVLAWIRSQPSQWITFVANQVAEIQSLTITDDCHVRSTDFLSRGVSISYLKDNEL